VGATDDRRAARPVGGRDGGERGQAVRGSTQAGGVKVARTVGQIGSTGGMKSGAFTFTTGDNMNNLPSHALETLNTLITYHDRNAEHGRTVAEALEILRAILGGNILPELPAERADHVAIGQADLYDAADAARAEAAPTSHRFKVGDRVVLRRDVERYPNATIAKGSTGTVISTPSYLSVHLDDKVEGLNHGWLVKHTAGDHPCPAHTGLQRGHALVWSEEHYKDLQRDLTATTS